MLLTYLGHNGFLIEYSGKTLLIDPFVTGNPMSEGKIKVDEIRCDYFLITHAHGDHTADVEAVAANNPAAVLVSNYEIATHYGTKGIPHHPMNHGGAWNFDFGRVRYVHAVHTSSFPDGKYGGQPGGFVLYAEGEPTVYIAGDTALTLDMQLIPRVGPPVDVAILPIGGNFTMDYADAVLAAEFVGCDRVVGCHYDTFGFIKIDTEAAKAAFEGAGKTLFLPGVGGKIRFEKG